MTLPSLSVPTSMRDRLMIPSVGTTSLPTPKVGLDVGDNGDLLILIGLKILEDPYVG